MLTPTRPLIDIIVSCSGARWRISVRGELDLLSGDDLTGVAGVLAAAPIVAVDIDLADVTFIDSAGWEAVAAARHRIVESGSASEVVATSPVVTRYLGLVRSLTGSATAR